MKRLIACLALTGALAVAACDDPDSYNEADVAEASGDEALAPAAEDAGVPAAAPSAVDTPPTDTTTLPADKRTSEDSVKPESETLFY